MNISKIANLSDCLSDILKSYEESDSELSLSNSSRSMSSYLNDSLSSVSDIDSYKLQDEQNFNREITISDQYLKPVPAISQNIIMVKSKTRKMSEITNQIYTKSATPSICKSLVG
jgi:hypothetical protein